MRGKVSIMAILCLTVRITPAHAGKRHQPKDAQFLYLDHPRACGEKVVFLIDEIQIEGSPPRMRGKVPRLRGDDL